MRTDILKARPIVRPKLDDKSETRRVGLVAPDSWVKRVDEWRRQQPDLPNLSEAIRMLVDRAIDAETRGD